MKLLVDMNLSPGWVGVLEEGGWQAIHWTAVGEPDAADRLIMDWANTNGYVLFTHDLDFGALLANSAAQGPSVVQVRAHDVMPYTLGSRLLLIRRQYESVLQQGAIITVDEARSRVRILPLS